MASTDQNGLVSIPVIDIQPCNPEAPQQLLDAASEYGFVFVENNESGIEPEAIDRMFELSQAFFAAPVEVKEEVSISSNKAGKNFGWLSRGVEKLDPTTQQRPDVKEAFNIGEPVDGQFQQPMPKQLESHVETMIDFQRRCHQLCQAILQ